MKKAYLLAVLLSALSCCAHAQTFDTTTFYGKLGFYFNPLDKSQISTGMLREYGVDFASLELFTGQFLNDTNYASISDWRMVYQTLYSQQINSYGTLVGLDTVNNTIAPYTLDTLPVAFAMLYYNYQAFDSAAVANNLISISGGQLHDVSGRTQSPYKNHYAFCVAPIRQAMFVGTSQMIFRSQLFFTNVSKTISTIQVDPYGSGIYQTATINTPFSVTYASPGVYPVTVKITYTDASTNIGRSKVVVYNVPTGEYVYNGTFRKKDFGTGPPYALNDDIYYEYYNQSGPTPIVAKKAYLGAYGTGDYTIAYSKYNSTHKVLRPLIVVDGFDPYGFQTLNDYYIPQLSVDQDANPAASIPLNGSATVGLDNTDSLDLVYLHWSNSTDYIERNAYVLERLIQIVDSLKAANGSSAKNVLLGFSMGGLITRYALRDMERYGIDHQTRLFISHDVPYWGANVPVGLQLMVQHLVPWKQLNIQWRPFTISYVSMFPQLQAADTLFSSPAAKEMLIQRYILSQTGINGITPVSYTISSDNTAHIKFFDTLNAMGWPINCRNITLANGACNGTPAFPETVGQLVSVGGDSTLNGAQGYLAQLTLGLTLGDAGGLLSGDLSNFTIPINPAAELWSFVLGPVTTRATISINFAASTIPPTGTGEIYHAYLSIKRKLFFGLFSVTNNLVSTSLSSTTDMLPLDRAPGGLYNLGEFAISQDSLNADLHNQVGHWVNAALPEPNFCFVPTVSSLAITNPTTYLTSSICESVNCLNPAAVSDYYAPTTNEDHVRFETNNSNWILKEIPASYSCQKICPTSVSISGDSLFCTVSHQYSISGLPSGDTLFWTAAPSSPVTIYHPHSDTTTISRNTSALVALSATFPHTCGVDTSIVISKNVRVGIPTYYTGSSLYNTSGESNEILQYCNDNTLLVSQAWQGTVTTSDQVATSYVWSFVSKTTGTDAELYNNPNGQNVTIDIKPTGGSAVWQLSIINACGSYWQDYAFNGNTTCNIVNVVQGPSENDYSLTPNPATNTLTVSTIATDVPSPVQTDGLAGKTSKTPATQAHIARILIFTSTGRLVQDVTESAGQTTVTIPVATFTNGAYFVQIIDDQSRVRTKKLIIER